MKTRIRPYTVFLLKQNAPYLTTAAILLLVTIGLAFFMLQKINDVDTKIKASREQVTALGSKRATLKSVVGESSENLDEDLQIVTTLIPDSEDYFSIITALERLSSQTGFHIDSYLINLLASNSNKLSLTVNGTGDSQQFLNFLQNYQLNGGRLITAEQIGIDPQETGSIRMDLNFYSRKASADGTAASVGPSLAELNNIKSKISFSLAGPPASDQIGDYPTKTDPF